MNIGIVGSRKRTRHEDYMALMDAFALLWKVIRDDIPVNLISGGCPTGADSWVHDIAEYYELEEPMVYQANWELHGRAAGPIRNSMIAKDADALIAVVSADRTGGTEDCIMKFKQYHPDGEIILV